MTDIVRVGLPENAASDGSGENTPKKVRGRPFEPGNPGRPRGSKNKTTHHLNQLVDANGEQLVGKMIELALSGNAACARRCFDHLLPPRNGRPIDFSFPQIKKPQDLAQAAAAITNAVADGTLTVEEAAGCMKLLDNCANILKTHDQAERLEELENRLKKETRR